MMEDGCADDTIPLPEINSVILEKVIEYCRMHATVNNWKCLKDFDAKFVRVDAVTLRDLFLDIICISASAQARCAINEMILTARDGEATHWMMEPKFFFSLN